MIGRKQEINLQITQLIDVALLVLAILTAYLLRAYIAPHLFDQLPELPTLDKFYWLMALIGPFTPIALENRGFYQNISRKTTGTALVQILRAASMMGLAVAFFVVFFRWEVASRTVLLLGGALSILFLLLRVRLLKMMISRRWLITTDARDRVLLVGRKAQMQMFVDHISPEQALELEFVGMYDVDGYDAEGFVKQLHEHSVSRVVFLAKQGDFGRVEQAVQACETEGVESWLSADFFQMTIARPSFDVLGGRLMLVFHSTPNPSWALFLKNVMDRVGALAFIVASSPLWIIAMIGIKLSSKGPVFFYQDRAGRYGKPFKMLKFRTMVSDAEDLRKLLEANNEMDGPVFKIKDDPRIFKFGKWLRRLSIDELPQMINVLQGDMSLVGPRPLPVYEIQKIEKQAQRRRLSMKPGLTCLWQVGGRNKITSFDEWVALDLQYIDNWSLALDCKILAKTLPAVLRGSGAH